MLLVECDPWCKRGKTWELCLIMASYVYFINMIIIVVLLKGHSHVHTHVWLFAMLLCWLNVRSHKHIMSIMWMFFSHIEVSRLKVSSQHLNLTWKHGL